MAEIDVNFRAAHSDSEKGATKGQKKWRKRPPQNQAAKMCGMIKASKAGFLFKSTEQIKKDNPELPAYETYDELMEAIKKAL